MARPEVTYNLRAVDRSADAFRSVEGRLSGLTKGFGRLAGLAAASGIAGVVAGVRRAAEETDRFAKLADRLGGSAQGIASIGFAAQQSGIDLNAMTTALQRLRRRAAEAAVGTGEARDAFRRLGIDAAKFSQLRLEDQFFAVARAFESIKDPGERVRLAFKLFDTEGVRVLQVLSQGERGVRALTDEFASLAGVMDAGVVDQSTRVTDAFGRLTTAFEGAGRSLVRVFGEGVEIAVNKLAELVGAANQAAEKIDGFRSIAVRAFSSLATAAGFDEVGRNLDDLADGYAKASEEAKKLRATNARGIEGSGNENGPSRALGVFNERLKTLGTVADEARRKQQALREEIERTRDVNSFLDGIEGQLARIREARDILSGKTAAAAQAQESLRSSVSKEFGAQVATSLFAQQGTDGALKTDQLKTIAAQLRREITIGALGSADEAARAQFVIDRVRDTNRAALDAVEAQIRGSLSDLLTAGQGGKGQAANFNEIERNTGRTVETLSAILDALKNGLIARAA